MILLIKVQHWQHVATLDSTVSACEILETQFCLSFKNIFFKEILSSDPWWPLWRLRVTIFYTDYILNYFSVSFYKSSNNYYYIFFSTKRDNIFKHESILFFFQKASIAHRSSKSFPKGFTIFYYSAASYTEKNLKVWNHLFKKCFINAGHSLFLYCGVVLCFVLFL